MCVILTRITQTIYLEGSPSALLMILSKGAVALKVVVTHSENNLWSTTTAAAAAASVSGSSIHDGGGSHYTAAGTAYGDCSIAETAGTYLAYTVLYIAYRSAYYRSHCYSRRTSANAACTRVLCTSMLTADTCSFESQSKHARPCHTCSVSHNAASSLQLHNSTTLLRCCTHCCCCC